MYGSTTNEAWVETLHKDNAKWAMLLVHLHTTANTGGVLMATFDNANNNGIRVMSASAAPERMELRVCKASNVALINVRDEDFPLNNDVFNVDSLILDEAGGADASSFGRNGTTGTEFDGAYSSPDTTNATGHLALGSVVALDDGGTSNIIPSGSAVAQFAMWQGTVPTRTAMNNLSNSVKTRYGL